jgi:hypothetical protein
MNKLDELLLQSLVCAENGIRELPRHRSKDSHEEKSLGATRIPKQPSPKPRRRTAATEIDRSICDGRGLVFVEKGNDRSE